MRRALTGSAGRLVAVFVAVPAALFGVPAAFGTTWVTSDNLIQNFPLRVLVGVDLSHGHLPLWNPYLWSGTSLLAGFSAGAAYPATALFAVVPGALAWVGNQVLVEVVAATGMVALLRVLGRSWLAAGLGALAFTYGGFMAAQSVHIDVVEGASWVPWAFVAVDRLAHRPATRPAAPWVALLGASLGLMMLSGSTEPILDAGVAMLLYALWLAWRTPGRRRHVLLGSAAGLAIGVLTAGAQLVPGAFFQAQSQRAAHSYQYFVSGSMNKSLTILGLDPLLLGGGHSFPIGYFATYNLSEVSSYIGILPVMALVGLLARRHRRSPEAGQWWIWYVILAVALVMCWGGFTPVGHLLYKIPLFNRQRLLNRNLLDVDLSLAVIFAVWVDQMFVRPAPASPPPATAPDPGAPSGRRRRWTSDVVLPLVPPLAVVGLQVVLLAGGTWFPHFLHVPGPVTRSTLWPLVAFLSIPSAIAVAAGAAVVLRRRLSRRVPALLVGLMVIDLLVFNATVQMTPDRTAATSSTSPWANELAATVRADTPRGSPALRRMALFDPDRFYPLEVDRLGQPDLTVLRSLPSVQGYGALVNGAYASATGAHTQLSLDPTDLDNGVFAGLDLGVLVSVPEYFLHLVAPPPHFSASTLNGATYLPPGPPTPSASPAPPSVPLPPATPPGDFSTVVAPSPTLPVGAGHPDTVYFGTVLSVTGVELPLAAGSAHAGDTVTVGLLSPDGRTTTVIGTAPLTGTLVSVPARRAVPASGLVLETTARPGVFQAPVVLTAGQGTYRVDGSLRDIVTPPAWTFTGMIGIFPAFAARAPSGAAWVTGSPGRVRVLSDTPWGTESLQVSTTAPATLVRGESFALGWQATISPGGPAAVHRRGLVQEVSVPAGTHIVTFFYQPHRVVEGLATSALGVVALIGFLSWGPVTRRRRRHRPAPTPRR